MSLFFRELLHLHPDLIASPVLGSYGGIRVVLTVSIAYTSTLHSCSVQFHFTTVLPGSVYVFICITRSHENLSIHLYVRVRVSDHVRASVCVPCSLCSGMLCEKPNNWCTFQAFCQLSSSAGFRPA